MRIMVVAPGHTHSTYDVFTGLCAGLKRCGADVIPYPLEAALEVNQAARHLLDEHEPTLAPAFDPFAVSAHAIVGRAIWREVDWVLAVTGSNLHFGAVGTLRKAGIKTALLCTESPYLTLERERYDAQFYDVVFTNDKSAVGLFSPPAVYLPAAFNEEVHTVEGPRAAPCDVFFIGTGFPERRDLLSGVDWTGITLFLAGSGWDQPNTLMHNADVGSYYRSATISLNHHRTTKDYHSGQHITDAYSLGPRAYEIAACGGFQLMDDSRPEARDVFGTALATYAAGDAADLERQIRFWLTHPAERMAMAQGQRNAVRPHSWVARAAQVLDVLNTRKDIHSWQPSMA